METKSGILTNISPFGIPFKLHFLGLHVGDPWQLGRKVAQVYTLALIVLALTAARRAGDRRDQVVTWMALLALAALQSPFAPAYVTIGLLWATTLLSVEVRSVRGGFSLVLVWLRIAARDAGRSEHDANGGHYRLFSVADCSSTAHLGASPSRAPSVNRSEDY